jgi:sulfur-oxidizing protein SoxY
MPRGPSYPQFVPWTSVQVTEIFSVKHSIFANVITCDASAAEWNKAAFDAKTMDETMKALGGTAPAQSKDIAFTSTPDIAENGAVVPIGIASSIPKTESIAILIEKNPNILAAVFDIPAGTDPAISTRVKMGRSSNVYALVKADGKYYVASKEIKVTLGGCGG